jgi:hypothetical protein
MAGVITNGVLPIEIQCPNRRPVDAEPFSRQSGAMRTHSKTLEIKTTGKGIYELRRVVVSVLGE